MLRLDVGWRCLKKSGSDKGGPCESEGDLGSECWISFFRMVTQKTFLSLKLASHRTGGCGSVVGAFYGLSDRKVVCLEWMILGVKSLGRCFAAAKAKVTWAQALPAKEQKIRNKKLNIIHSHCHHHLLVSWRHMFFTIASWEVKARAFAGSTRSLPLPYRIIALMVSQQRIYCGSQRAAKEAKLIKKENHDEWFGSFFALLTLSCAAATGFAGFRLQIDAESEEFAKISHESCTNNCSTV